MISPTMNCLVMALALAPIVTAFAEESEPLNFSRDIRPILSAKCFACHGPDSKDRDAGFRLDIEEGAFADLGGYTAIVPGKPNESELVLRITAEDDSERMPPPKHKNPLAPEEIALLKRWIEEGAPYAGHWAFEPVKRPKVPDVEATIGNVIDQFIGVRLRREGLTFSPDAPAETLIRRLHLDLTGLPPTPSEVDAFLSDPDTRFEVTIDQLMTSSHFAERLALDWLDVARFADTNGYSIDDHRDMWGWRDWVIDAFQNNLPYDDFIRQQLAGDLMENATEREKIATGFLRNSMNTHEGGVIAEEYKVARIADQINTVSTAFLGLTVKCAQCHDHKYDPISTRDYYSFFAFFNTSSEPGQGAINGNTKPFLEVDPILQNPEEYKCVIEKRITTLKQIRAFPENILGDARLNWERETLTNSIEDGALIAVLQKPDHERTQKECNIVSEAFARANSEMDSLVSSLNGEIDILSKSLETGKTTVMIMDDAASDRKTPILIRGAYDQHGEIVNAAIPAMFGSIPESIRPDRLALANWLTDPVHPLTARVAVNRYWQLLFGTGIVKTTEDFGSQGEWPSHPELLDWLASEFVASGWDVRALLKTMLLSRTYRQASDVSKSLLEKDPYNRLLARAPRYRLPAESVRDSALAIGGLLDPTLGGPSVYPPQPKGLWKEVSHFGNPTFFSAQHFFQDRGAPVFRRSLYTFWKRTSPPPVMTAFDAPSRETCAVRRSLTNTPLQALVLMNAPQFVAASRGLAKRMMSIDEAVVTQIRHGFRLSTARYPSAEELTILKAAYDRQLAYFKEAPDRTNSFLGFNGQPKAAAMSSVASLILNLDETITRE